jgi:maleate cis-trans isomerase
MSNLTNCKKDDNNTPAPTAASQIELLIANNWRTVRVATPYGQEINKSRLNLATQVLYDLNMQFRNNGTVRALDPKQSNSVVNNGTWKLTPDNQSIDVDVSGFKGNFPIIQLTKTKLILRQRAPVDGKNADINLEFDPTL